MIHPEQVEDIILEAESICEDNDCGSTHKGCNNCILKPKGAFEKCGYMKFLESAERLNAKMRGAYENTED